jgi:hypothetical protein
MVLHLRLDADLLVFLFARPDLGSAQRHLCHVAGPARNVPLHAVRFASGDKVTTQASRGVAQPVDQAELRLFRRCVDQQAQGLSNNEGHAWVQAERKLLIKVMNPMKATKARNSVNTVTLRWGALSSALFCPHVPPNRRLPRPSRTRPQP